ncbi:MAG TPA: hypothetical protein VL494_13780 [Steroidobacteraceae bacterium]|jgi:hypothetical protein|nr:hypothetical protein [Steroidobacteraceae bacterium]
MTTLSTVPVYAAPNRDTQVIFALTGTGANFVRVWVTAAPPGSELRKKLDDSGLSRIPFYEGDGGEKRPERRRFDVGGKYTLVAQEYTRGASSYGGGYQRSPDGAPSETKVGGEATLSLFIGQRLTSEISVGADTVTVVLWVWDATIRATTQATHGEVSPAVLATSGTTKALAVIESTSVRNALIDLVDVAAGTAVGDVATVFADLIAKWNAHLIETGIHQTDDADNGLPVALGSTASAKALAEGVTEAIPKLRQHYLNDAVMGGVASGRDSADYHEKAGVKKNDNRNLPLIAGASELSDSYWAVADLCRSYDGHRAALTYHLFSDTVNLLADRPALMALGEVVLSVLASTSAVAPPTQSSGAMWLIASAGFAEKPL